MALNISASGGNLNITSVANIFAVVFRGEGLDDGTSGGTYTGSIQQDYEVVVDTTGGTDTFKWRRTGIDFVTGVAMTGGAQTLDSGVTITFAATTGHDLYDRWTIRASAADESMNHSINTTQIIDTTVSGDATGISQINKDSILWIDYKDVLTPVVTSGTDLQTKINNLTGSGAGAGDDVTFVLVTTVSTEVLAADATRQGATITNNSDQVVQVSYGDVASATSFSVALDPRTAAGQPIHYLEVPKWAVGLQINAHALLTMTGDNNILVNDVTPA